MSINFTLLNGIFLLALVITLILFRIGRKYKEGERKKKVYTGGERINPKELQLSSESLFWPIKKAFKPFYNYLLRKHSGKVSDYLAWILLALILIILFLWGVKAW